MAKKAFDDIMAGLHDAVRFAQGDKAGSAVHQIEPVHIDVPAIRKKLGLSQEKFAHAFGISVATVRGWEQGQRTPTGPARALLTFIDKEPEAAIRALQAA